MSNGEKIQLWNDRHVFGGMDILRARCRNHRYSPHTHDVFVIAAFRDGAQKHQISSARGIAYPGTVMVIPPGVVHTGESAHKDTGWSYSAFYPSAQILTQMSMNLFGDNRGSLDFGTTYMIEDKTLAERLLYASDIAHDCADILKRQEAVYNAFELLIRRYGRRSCQLAVGRRDVAPVHKGLEFMRANLRQSLKIQDIAAAAELSEFHFMRLFKARMNMSVHQTLTQLRLEAAKSMLAAGATAAAAATDVGFYDQSHFTRNFRRAFGLTPKRYATGCR